VQLPSNWISAQFANTSHPFVVDIGCSKGSWGMQYAADHSDRNVLGLDIREPVIQLANDRVDRLGVPNVHYIATNANVNITRILKDIAELSKVELVTINFPDPYFKKKQFKRRLVDDNFVISLARGLPAGCEVFFQSDVLDLTELAVEKFSCPWFSPSDRHDVRRLIDNNNPTGVLTEREMSVLKRELSVYRMSFTRTVVPVDD
jgi:tRNA (guanine-N7-)-methyltransferase